MGTHSHSSSIDTYRKIALAVSTPILVIELINLFIGLGLPSFYLYLSMLLINIFPVVVELKETLTETPFSIDTLMFIAGVSAFLIGSYLEAGLVLWLYNLAEVIEERVTDKVKDAVEKLMESIPKKVIVNRNGELVEVPVEECSIGDVVIVRKGEMIPVDGVIEDGETVVDESNLTGESIPVEKRAGDEVFSGSINLGKAINVKITKNPEDFMVRRILKLVLESRERKAKIEGLVQRFAKIYTPIIISLALAMVIIPPIVIGGDFRGWVYRAIAILVIGCPSAFLISVPLTSLIGLISGMRMGVMVKGSIYFEEINRSKIVAFDKTGTLTIGELVLSKITTFNGATETEVLKYVASIERLSTHPLAVAIVREAEKRSYELLEPVDVEEFLGEGIKGVLKNGVSVIVGKLTLLKRYGVEMDGLAPTDTTEAKMKVFVAINGKLSAMLTFDDNPRKESYEVVQKLKKMGYKTVMLSGDKKEIVESIAKELGIDEYYAELKPEEKLEWIRKLKEKGKVLMVGDGVNDAPALSEADVGVAISKLGNNVAMESADVVILKEKIHKLIDVIKLGKRVVGKQRINLFSTLILKAALVVLGALGYVSLWEAVLGDDGLTIVLALNSLTLLYNGRK